MLLSLQGKEFTGAEFRQPAESLCIQCFYVATEPALSLGLVKGYHKPIKRIMARIKAAAPNQHSLIYSTAAMKALNGCANYRGICPTTLMHGDPPRPPIGDCVRELLQILKLK